MQDKKVGVDMKIELIQPLSFIEDTNSKSLTKKVYVCLHDNDQVKESLSHLMGLEKQVLYVPSPKVFWNTDFMLYEKKLKATLKSSKNIYYLNNRTKTFTDKTNHSYRFIGGVFWNDYNDLNEESVTLSLMKSPNFSKIKANTWFDNQANSDKFKEINDTLLKNNTYYRTYIQYYKAGFFHPIISYMLYNENMAYLKRKMAQPFEGTTIVLSYNHPTSHALYFNDIQVENHGYKIYQKLGKQPSIDLYIGRKAGLEKALEEFPIDYLFHANSDKAFLYRYHDTNVFCADNQNHLFDFRANNTKLARKKTIQYLMEENQKFVEIVKQSLLSLLQVIENTTDLNDFVKAYNNSLLLLRTPEWKTIFVEKKADIKDISLQSLHVSQQEVNSNQLNPEQYSKRINSILTTISHNHFSLQELYNHL